jgi:hypothetical protein
MAVEQEPERTAPPQPDAAPATIAEEPVPEDYANHGLLTPGQVSDWVAGMGEAEYIIDGLIPTQTIALAMGKSNEGKSPCIYQLGHCVAAGIPFLGRATKQGAVVIYDGENPYQVGARMMQQLLLGLGLQDRAHTLPLYYHNLNNPIDDNYGSKGHTIEDYVRKVKPSLVVLDPVYAYYPDIEENAQKATKAYQKMRKLMADTGCAIIGVAHPRKEPGKTQDKVPPLEKADLSSWFQQLRGSSAMINGSDIRLGFDRPSSKSGAELIIRGFARATGGDAGHLYGSRARR